MLPNYIPDWNNPKSSLIKKSETQLMVTFKNSGGQLYIYGADRPELMRGPNPMGVVLDEFSVQKREVWDEVVQPIMRANPDAWCWFLFTPRGKNHAFEVFQYGKEERDGEWKSWEMDIYTSGIFEKQQIDNLKTTSLEQTFNQEYLCQFLEGEGSVFRGVKDVMTATPEKPNTKHIYVMGVDLAKVQDYTVIVVYDRKTNKQVYQNRFQTIEWPFQKKRIIDISRHYNNALTVVDATGLGDPIADDLMRAGVPVEPYKITPQTKKDMIEKLSIWIEQGKIEMLPIEETGFEFDNFSYDISITGKVRYHAIEGFHDDIVIAHGLAVSQLQPLIVKKPRPEINVVSQAYKRAVKRYENPEDPWSEYYT